jgi:hypothetical protein
VAKGLIMNVRKHDMMLSSVPKSSTITNSPTPSNMFPEELQLQLYQAFIFSIPILFSIILFLLFYLFYLKRRASSFTPHLFPRINPPTTYRYYSSSSVSSFIHYYFQISFHHIYSFYIILHVLLAFSEL